MSDHDMVRDAVDRVVKEAIRQASADTGEANEERVRVLAAEGIKKLQANLRERGIGIDLRGFELHREEVR